MYENKYHTLELNKNNFLITGGAGFIGSNIVEYLIKWGAKKVRILDNLSTGHLKNIDPFLSHESVEFIKGDIRDIKVCKNACKNIDYVFHQAALGSVPRSIKDPITTNEVNVSGFINMLVAAKDNNIKRVVYAASSSTYGDSKGLPKVEGVIGKPLSPYAITKYVNELYADIFSNTYGMETIGLRYFNVFGQRQDPNGAYAAVVPKFILQFIKHESPTINGDGSFSRDFTYIDNVIQMNMRAISSTNKYAVNQVYNTAYGARTTLNQLITSLKSSLAKLDKEIKDIEIIYGPNRIGDIPHSLASIEKAFINLNYNPNYSIEEGLHESIKWYWDNLK